MLYMFTIENRYDNTVFIECFARVINLDRIVLYHKQNVGGYLVHALSVSNIGIELAESEEDIG